MLSWTVSERRIPFVKVMKGIGVFIIACAVLIQPCALSQDQSADDPAQSDEAQRKENVLRAGEGQVQRRFRPAVKLSGRALLDDGSLPPKQVKVSLICQGEAVRHQTHTEEDGFFSLEVDYGHFAVYEGAPPDASVPATGRFGVPGELPGFWRGFGHPVSLNPVGFTSKCQLEAELEGYRSERIPILGQPRSQYTGVIVLSPTFHGERGTVSANTLRATEEARQSFEKAILALNKTGKPDTKKAARELSKAVKEYPEFSEAWHILGALRLEKDDADGAREAFGKAMEAEPDYVGPYLSLAQMELDAGNIVEAVQLSNRAIRISPKHPEALYLFAVTNSALGNMALAEASARKVHEGRFVSQFPNVHYVLGFTLSKRAEYEGAAAEFRHYLEVLPEGPLATELGEQVQRWEDVGLVQPVESSPPQE